MAYALITGGSKGIGRAIAFELAAKGFDILLVARTEQDLLVLSEEIGAKYAVQTKYFVADLSNADAIERVFRWVSELNINLGVLVNNAGYGLSGFFETQDLSSLNNMMYLNMINLAGFTHRFLPLLRKQKRAYILNVASTAAYQATPGLSTYAATKSFVLSFSRGLQAELKGTSVSVTCISPGPTNTAFFERANLSPQGLEMIKKVHMSTEKVGKVAVEAMLKGKAEVIPGLQNKSVAFMSWLFPKYVVETVARKLLQNAIPK